VRGPHPFRARTRNGTARARPGGAGSATSCLAPTQLLGDHEECHRALGYAGDGEAGVVRRRQRARLLRFRMSRQHWGTIRRDDIEIEGLEAALPMFGLV